MDEYDRVLSEWFANGRRLPGSTSTNEVTVVEVIAAYLPCIEKYYVKNGQPTGEDVNIKLALRPLRRMYGRLNAEDFTPRKLKSVRQTMIEAGHSRKVINRNIRRIKAVFKWGVESELIHPNIYQSLQAVAGLREGRSAARETEPVKPVPDEYVDAVKPHVGRQISAMIELQRLTGMRSGEVTSMRGCDLETTDELWIYTPAEHKTEHHGHRRTIPLGPKCREIIRPFLKSDLSAYLFSPKDAESDRNAGRRNV
jgi:integrase